MITLIIRFINIVMAGLVAGTIFGIWLGYNPKTFSFSTYLEQQQAAIKALNTIMPLLGLITIILTLISAFLQKGNTAVFITLIIAAVLLVIAGLITKFGNQPINKIIMTWKTAEVPGNWAELRDKWWALHMMRTLSSFLAFCLIVWASMRKD
jgi:Domain of unknown function (DUF1772)